jgi:hypothetical protein
MPKEPELERNAKNASPKASSCQLENSLIPLSQITSHNTTLDLYSILQNISM